MNTVLKGISVVIGVILTVLVIWWSFAYAPFIDEIKSDIATAKADYPGDITELYNLVVAAETESGISVFASREAFRRNAFSEVGFWHLNDLLWWVSNQIILSKDEEFYLWLRASPLNEWADKSFHASLNELPLEKQSEIISMVKSPSYFSPGSERLKKRAAEVLERYRAF